MVMREWELHKNKEPGGFSLPGFPGGGMTIMAWIFSCALWFLSDLFWFAWSSSQYSHLSESKRSIPGPSGIPESKDVGKS